MKNKNKKLVDCESFDLLDYFLDGSKIYNTDFIYKIKNNCFYVGDVHIAYKHKNFILLNGDEDVYNRFCFSYFFEVIQEHKNSVTTSFSCLNNAGIKIEDIEIVNISSDLSKSCTIKSKGFKNFEKNIPQGATYTEFKNTTTGKIYEKQYHRAGSSLIKYNGFSYICGMDENSFFVSKLKTNPKNIDDAYKSLKPRCVKEFERKTGKPTIRQGEWFFIPVKVSENIKNKLLLNEDKPLPKETEDSNDHLCEFYVKHNNIHYCSDFVIHNEHADVRLDGEHKAIKNTALGSWSVTGVD